MSKSTVTTLAIIACTILFGYAGAALLATEAGRAMLGAVAGLMMVVAVIAAGRMLLPFRDPAAY